MKFEIGPIKYDSDKFKAKRREKKLKKQKMEFSKQILVIAWLSGSIVIAFACYLTYMMVIHGHDGNVELIAIILTGGFAEITAGTGFYYWKSRLENSIKLKSVYGDRAELLEECEENGTI